MSHHYNPDWLSDDALLASFVARQNDFAFLNAELARAPLQGNVQHYLLVGVRGAGKTTLLKRLAVAIRRDQELSNHLIALSFPEELYQVKNLSDFWWAACEALIDELDHLEQTNEAERLLLAIDQSRKNVGKDNDTIDAGFKLLQETCARLQKRPVMLVDNLDMLFERIDKSGRKLNNPHSPAYWALREALSTNMSPIVIGGSVRLTDAFTDYDKAFYDFFLPKRLGKLSLEEVRMVLENLADAQNLQKVKEKLHTNPARIEALFELTGGNPRALGFIFELLRIGPNSRAVEDFERLMDMTTPYYKARIEEQSEQAQVIMHALAVYDSELGLRFGHTAAELGRYTNLPTSSISAQLSLMENDGLIEKSHVHGRTQYRIAEQMFRLWLQMRATRRIRQNVISLAKFFEAMYDQEELQAKLKDDCGVSALAGAKYAFAVASTRNVSLALRNEAEAYGTERVRDYIELYGGEIEDYLSIDDNREGFVYREGNSSGFDIEVEGLREKFKRVILDEEFVIAEKICRQLIDINPNDAESWFDLALLMYNQLKSFEDAEKAYRKVIEIEPSLSCGWNNLGVLLDEQFARYDEARTNYLKAIELEPENPKAYINMGNLLAFKLQAYTEAEEFYTKAIELDSSESIAWNNLGTLLNDKLGRYDESEKAYRKAIELNPKYSTVWDNLGNLLNEKLERYEDAEKAYREVIAINPNNPTAWIKLGVLLHYKLERYDAVEDLYRKAIELDPNNADPWIFLGILLMLELNRYSEAETAFRTAIKINPSDARAWNGLSILLVDYLKCYEEGEQVLRKAIELDADDAQLWTRFGIFLTINLERYDEADLAFQRAIKLKSDDAGTWLAFGVLLEQLRRREEALTAYKHGIEFDIIENSFWRKKYTDLLTELCVENSEHALIAEDKYSLNEALKRLFEHSIDIAAALVSRQFIETFLAVLLKKPASALIVLNEMRSLGYERHARPLVLAFEAAIENKAEMLAELEPELQGATMHMYERLTGKPKKKRSRKSAKIAETKL
ncbi:tetratricopeptide repeat protein [Undibacterium sp. TC9W]|uniref:tetratricopeptide repeat protein n=1 Tax=Undibacterium sp. TC9W TaxID=3413053 RepID=UPI003BEFF56F